MSAIFGIYYFDRPLVAEPDLNRMLDILAHRGSDGAATWRDGPVGLGHRMLWTTPESVHEKLPHVNQTGDLVITADGRIDNRAELAAALGIVGVNEYLSDSELILHAYHKWGEGCPERLLGDFAFAIWDRRRQVLFCARDHFGVRPFHYYSCDRMFVFASEIKALFCLPEVPRRLNELRVADYLVPILEDDKSTFYEGIFRLSHAHCMTVSREATRSRRYWALDPSRDVHLASDQEYAEAFREIFTEAVRCRLRSAFPIGAMLSGGLDSSSIVCVARQLLSASNNKPLNTFSLIFDDVPQCDERPFIDAVLDQGGLHPHYVHGDQLSLLADLDRTFDQEDEPFQAPNMFLHRALYRAAHQQNVRVLLDGFGGDTTVSHGRAHLTEMAGAGRWGALRNEINGLSRNVGVSPWKLLWGYVIWPLVPRLLIDSWRMVRRRNRPPWNPLISSEFARRIDLAGRVRALQGISLHPPKTARQDHSRLLCSALIPYLLNGIDLAAQSWSIAPAYPFCDSRLAQFCLALPPAQKMHEGFTRVVMRRALADVLPNKVRWRGGKANFSSNFDNCLLTRGRELLATLVLNELPYVTNYVNLDAAHKTYYDCLSGQAAAKTVALWSVVTLAVWLRRFLEIK